MHRPVAPQLPGWVLRLPFTHSPALCAQGWTNKISSHLQVCTPCFQRLQTAHLKLDRAAVHDIRWWDQLQQAKKTPVKIRCWYLNTKYPTSAFACSHSHSTERNSPGGCYGNKSLEVPTWLHRDVLYLQKETDLHFEQPGGSAKGWQLEVRFLKASQWFGGMRPLVKSMARLPLCHCSHVKKNLKAP